ncbi:uncharacterized protein LOC126739477 [Anthonomus grandis grandis]|uniref:uncharacterized protein LOC126739477 n=1 Tax=Anthonomus grandis grandis TaxID=2921223 RepID=UPI002165B95E|nr:uncharacterized protein LOC126739477 [Anthonomus grandis grandis]
MEQKRSNNGVPQDSKCNSKCELPTIRNKTSTSMNHSCWEGHKNEQKFLEALVNFMVESWAVVCQIREKYGLAAEYQLSSTEISRRIDDVSKKLELKLNEVQMLERQKTSLLSKSVASSVAIKPGQRPPQRIQPVFSNAGMNRTPSRSCLAVGRKLQFSGSPQKTPSFSSSLNDPCPPSCHFKDATGNFTNISSNYTFQN